MTKGKPWHFDEERQLRQLLEEGKSVEEISRVMVKTVESVRQKMFNLQLKEKQNFSRKPCFCSSKLDLPADLPTVEKTLQILAAALWKSDEAGLGKDEVQRLQVVANLAKMYKDAFADYVDYRGIEERLVELEAKYRVLVTK